MTSTSGCPPDDVWPALVADGLSDADARRHTEHASDCERCARRLKSAVHDLQSPMTEEEAQQYERSVESSPKWQADMAAALAARVQARQRRRQLATLAAAAVVAAAVFVAWRFQRARSLEPNRLLAQAYSEQRTIELRFRNAAHAPLRVRRADGSNLSQLDRPTALIDAEAEIKRGLSNDPDSSTWLHAKGRADLLAWNYESAIRTLRRALEENPTAPDLLTDLASAYFERAEVTRRDMDYGTALDLLGQALQQDPNDPVVLFNHAIVAGRLRLYNEAIADFDKLLIIEPTGGWAGEARTRLQQLRQERDRGAQRQPIPETPSTFLQHLATNAPGVGPHYLDQRADELLERALTSWIPLALSGSPEAAAAHRALDAAADWLAANAGDTWLRDLLQEGLSDRDGLLALREAAATNLAGDPSAAESWGRRAAMRFSASRNVAGAARAHLEMVYSAHRLVDASRCLALAKALTDEIAGRRYRWTEAQLWIEDSICATMQGKFDQATTSIDRAMDIARAAHYDTLHLRAIGIKAALQNTLGNTAASWSQNLSGLERYWTGVFPPQRAYQFYADLAFAAQRLGRWHLATSIAQEAVRAIERTPNKSTQAMAWHRLGTLAQQAKLNEQATRAFRQANRIFASLPHDEASRRYRIDCSINLAFLEAAVSDVSSALRQLESLHDDIQGLSDINVTLRYYFTLGMLYLRANDQEAAESSLRRALDTSDGAFQSLKNEADREAWERETEQIHRGLVEVLLSRSKPAEAFRLWESFRAVHRDRHHAEKSSKPIAGEVLLSYAQTSSGLALWAIGAHGLTSRLIDTSSMGLERLIRRFASECADPDGSLAGAQRDGRELYKVLIEPMAHLIGARDRLLIEPDGALSEVPFQALIDAAGQPVGKAREVVVLVRGGTELRSDWRGYAISGGERALIVGAPAVPAELSATFLPLPSALEEARDVASRFARNVLLTDRGATLPAVMRELPSAGLFHFAGHAAHGADGGALVLAEDGAGLMLGAKQLDPVRLPQCRLAVLSACGTGTPSDEDRVSRLGLVRKFVRAGVPQVLATRWDIDSSAAAAFMHTFYGALIESGSAAAALRHAIGAAIDAPATAHPYYWAAFALYTAS